LAQAIELPDTKAMLRDGPSVVPSWRNTLGKGQSPTFLCGVLHIECMTMVVKYSRGEGGAFMIISRTAVSAPRKLRNAKALKRSGFTIVTDQGALGSSIASPEASASVGTLAQDWRAATGQMMASRGLA
jgi:hypothetical protein